MNRRTLRVAALLAGSGTCALIYQVAWLRELRLIFGASTAASAAVLAIFMGGLGLGGIILGRRADRHRNPLALYANLEFGIAIFAATTPLLVWLVRWVYIELGGASAMGTVGATFVRLLMSVLVLAVPTTLMGGTLPAAARAVETREDVSRRHLALLYGLNTLGAVVGAWLSTFVLLEHLGTRRTLFFAAGLNLGVAILARVLARRPEYRRADVAEGASATGGRDPAVSAPASLTGVSAGRLPPKSFVLVSCAVAGAAFLLMELVWYRMLAPLLGGTTYTFGLILAVALLGIGIGGLLYSLLLRNRVATLSGLALTCALEAAFIAVPYALGDRIAVMALMLRGLGEGGLYTSMFGWATVISVVVLPAAIVTGVQFPLLVALLGRGDHDVGRQSGLAYAWNTLGAIVGSLAGGFGLIPLLSAPGAWRAGVLILVLLGVGALALHLRLQGSWRAVRVPCVLLVAACVLLLGRGPTAAWRHTPIGVGRVRLISFDPNTIAQWQRAARRWLHWETDGLETSIGLKNQNGLAFLISGKNDGNAWSDAPTQIMGGLIGSILHPDPRSTLIVGLGTGSTAGWLARVPGMQRVDVVELEPGIGHVAQACAAVNEDVMNNDRVNVLYADAREYILTTGVRYDLIVSEPSNPFLAGTASLYTHEFYLAALNRLEPGGIFMQWFQAYQVDAPTVRLVLATLGSVFENVDIWQTKLGDLIMLAHQDPLPIDVDALRDRLTGVPYRDALAKAWRVDSLEGFLARFVANGNLVRRIARDDADRINTDDRIRLEFSLARLLGRSSPFNVMELRQASRSSDWHRPLELLDSNVDPVDWSRVADETMLMFAVFGAPPPLPRDASDEQVRLRDTLIRYMKGDLRGVHDMWRNHLPPPRGLIEKAISGHSAAVVGDARLALRVAEELRAHNAAEAHALEAIVAWQTNRASDAVEALEATFLAFRDPQVGVWAWSRLMQQALGLGPRIIEIELRRSADLSSTDPARSELLGRQAREHAVRLFDALAEPFPVYVYERDRLVVRLKLVEDVDASLAARALEAVEPHTFWNEEFLDRRVRIYETVGHPRLAVAQRELDRFRRDRVD